MSAAYAIYDPALLKNVSLFLQNKMDHDSYRWYPMLDRAEIMLCCSDSVGAMDMHSSSYSKQLLNTAIRRLKSIKQLNEQVPDRSACFFAYLCQNIYVLRGGAEDEPSLWACHDAAHMDHQQILMDVANLALFKGNNTIMSVPGLNLVAAVADRCELMYLNDDRDLIEKVTRALLDPVQLPDVLLRDLATTFRYIGDDTGAPASLQRFFASKFDKADLSKVRDYVGSIDTNMCMKGRFRSMTLKDIDRLFLMMDGRCYDLVDVAFDMAKRLRPDEQLTNLETETKIHMSNRIAQFLDKEANVEHRTAFLEALKNVEAGGGGSVKALVQKLFSGELHMQEVKKNLEVVGRKTCCTVFDFIGLVGFCCLGSNARTGHRLPNYALQKLDAAIKQLDEIEEGLGAAVLTSVPGLAAATSKLLHKGELSFEGYGASLLTAYSDIYAGLGIDWPAAPFVVLPNDDMRAVLPRLQALTCVRDDSRRIRNPLSTNFRVYGIFADGPTRFEHVLDVDLTGEFEDVKDVNDLEAYLCGAGPPGGVRPVSVYGKALEAYFGGEREAPGCLLWRVLGVPLRLQLERAAMLAAAAEHVASVSRKMVEHLNKKRTVEEDADDGAGQQQRFKGAAAWSPEGLSMKNRFHTKPPELSESIPLRTFVQCEYSWPTNWSGKAKIMWNAADLTDLYQRAELVGRIYVPYSAPDDFFATFPAYFKRISQKPFDLFHVPFEGLVATSPSIGAKGGRVPTQSEHDQAEATKRHVVQLFRSKTTAMDACSKLDFLLKVNETAVSAKLRVRMDLFVLLWHVFTHTATVTTSEAGGRRLLEARRFVAARRPLHGEGVAARFRFYTQEALCAFTFPEGVVNRAVGLHFGALLRDALLHRDLGNELRRKAEEWSANEKEINALLESANTTPRSTLIDSFVLAKLFIKNRIAYYKDSKEVRDFLEDDDALHFQMLTLLKAHVVTNVHSRGVQLVLDFVRSTSELFETIETDEPRWLAFFKGQTPFDDLPTCVDHLVQVCVYNHSHLSEEDMARKMAEFWGAFLEKSAQKTLSPVQPTL